MYLIKRRYITITNSKGTYTIIDRRINWKGVTVYMAALAIIAVHVIAWYF